MGFGRGVPSVSAGIVTRLSGHLASFSGLQDELGASRFTSVSVCVLSPSVLSDRAMMFVFCGAHVTGSLAASRVLNPRQMKLHFVPTVLVWPMVPSIGASIAKGATGWVSCGWG